MQGDFSRTTFDAADSYRAVLLQQGRVLLDADWNEQAEITAHHDEARTRDVVGPDGGPAPDPAAEPRTTAGPFAIVDPDGREPAATPWADLRVTAGTYYVAGLLCENPAGTRLADQPHLPRVPEPAGDRCALYLDVWTRHVTADEDPRLIEPALGGPDTTTRARTVWQVRHTAPAAGDSCGDLHAPGWLARTPRRMEAGLRPAVPGADPCQITGTGGYERLENQLYRVQVHDAAAGTFVWSRDNGSVTAALTALTPSDEAGTATLALDRAGRDEELSFREKQLVEVTSRDRELRGEPGHLAITGAPAGLELPVTWLDPGAAPASLDDLGAFPVVRRWDGGPSDIRATATDLEAGITVAFPAGGETRTGDYWTVPARTVRLAYGLQQVRGTIDWPGGAQPPAGVEHHVAPLVILRRDGAGWTLESDCRRLFPPLTGLATIDLVGGDGQEALPGEPLDRPVVVVVRNGPHPVAGVRVLADAGRGHLTGPGRTPTATSPSRLPDLVTDVNGLVAVNWLLDDDPAELTQSLLFRRIDDRGNPIDAPIAVSARLSVAARVRWSPACAGFAGAGTVQQALDQLVTTPELRLRGGDGQTAENDGDVLPQPVRVIVDSPCGPLRGVPVVASGSGLFVPAGEDDARPAALTKSQDTAVTDEDGLAAFWWQPSLGRTRSATLAVRLADTRSAAVRVAAQLDPAGQDGAPGLHLTALTFADETPFGNDSDVAAEQLVDGIRIVLDDAPEPDSVHGKPVIRIELDLPWPLAKEDNAVWADQPVGFRTITLDATFDLQDRVIVWLPASATRGWLRQRVWDGFAKGDWTRPVIGRLVIEGWAVTSATPPLRQLNTHARTVTKDGRTNIVLPTDDRTAGGVFVQWFRLVREAGERLTVEVPDVVGRTVAVARREIEDAGLVVSEVVTQPGDGTRRGLVMETAPAPGTRVAVGSGVVVVVSSGRL